VGEVAGQHYFSMDYIAGRNLDALNADRGVTGPRGQPWLRRAARYVQQIAEAIHYAHQRGILHRDLKPSNVLLDAADQPRVTDFGLARRLEGDSRLTASGAVLGSPSYMSPEQAAGRGHQLTTATDIYSLGAILYELLTGGPPFRGPTPVETMRRVMDEEPRPPQQLNPHVDRDLATICLKCLEKEPGRRYGSAERLVEDLDRWLRSEPIAARRVGNYERAKKWVRRRPAIAALAVGLTLSLVVGMAGVIWQWTRADQQAERATKTAEELRQNLYASEMGQAFHALEAGDVKRVRELLDAQPRDLRGFEWRYLWGQSRTQEVFTFDSGRDSFGCAVSPDGRYVAAVANSTLLMWDVASRQKVVTREVFPRESNASDDLAIDPQSKILAAALAGTHCIRLWNVETGQATEPVLPIPLNAHGVAFSPDGRWLATAGGHRYGDGIPGDAKIWDTSTWQPRFALSGVRDWLTRVKFSPDGAG
jgi:hypothetical protein